jgi:hypothetical protein
MTTRQIKIAASLINALYLSQTDTPDEIEGVSDKDVKRIIAATNAAGRRTLNYHEYEGPLTSEGVIQFVLDNF